MSHSDSTAPANIKEADKLTLYLIGHSPDAKYLERLIENVKPIIRGIGFVNTDDKRDCLEVLKKCGVPYVYESHVFEDRADFDFSLARNKAMEIAYETYGGWLFWLDCDDLIEAPEKIIEGMNKYEAEAFALPYDCGQNIDNVTKFRIHQYGDWDWFGPIHEELKYNNNDKQAEVIVLRKCIVKHSPGEEKSNHDFHISLLKRQLQESEAYHTYVAKEYFNSCRFSEAIEWIRKALAIHSFSHEKYNLWIMLGISRIKLNEPQEAIKAFEQAARERPHRKEAYYFLAELYLQMPEDASTLLTGFGYASNCVAQLDFKEPLQYGQIYNTESWAIYALYLQRRKDFDSALKVAEKAEIKTEKLLKIIEDCKNEKITPFNPGQEDASES